jgi:hypothetical protein
MFGSLVSFAFFVVRAADASPSSSSRLAVISATAADEDMVHMLLQKDTILNKDALLQEDADMARARHTKAQAADPNPARWFGDFSQAESTDTVDGALAGRGVNPALNVLDGWDPQQGNGNMARDETRPSYWFEETPSGGSKQAWQTFYPPERESIAGNRVEPGQWFLGTGGTRQQDYVEADSGDMKHQIPASWFDSEVQQLDGFGRQKLAGLGSPRNYLDWEERSVNTTLECKDPGCTANVSLIAPFDFNKEMVKNCKLSVFFRPTDFDNQYSGESVEWVQVNNHHVTANCRPMAGGCNKTAQRPLLPCVNSVAIDHIVPTNGRLYVAAKIPKVVDECPYTGGTNGPMMLSAVPMVTCLVSPKPSNLQVPKPVNSFWHPDNSTCVTRMPLQCSTRGCASEIVIPVNQTCASLGQCKLSINVTSTDYDGDEKSVELIEYIKVKSETNGEWKALKSNLKSDAKVKNPCKPEWANGVPIKDSDKIFSAVKDEPVNASTGLVFIEGKISEYVDECASNGYLLDAVAEVTCTKTKKAKGSLLAQRTRISSSTGGQW